MSECKIKRLVQELIHSLGWKGNASEYVGELNLASNEVLDEDFTSYQLEYVARGSPNPEEFLKKYEDLKPKVALLPNAIYALALLRGDKKLREYLESKYHKRLAATSTRSCESSSTQPEVNAQSVHSLPSESGESSQMWVDPTYPGKIMDHLNNLSCSTEFADVLLICGGKRIPAHRILLTTSEYFRTLFQRNVYEVEIDNVDSQALYDIVNYCYTGKVPLRSENVWSLLSAALRLKFPNITSACVEYLMKSSLTTADCVNVIINSIDHQLPQLTEAAREFAAEHFRELYDNGTFLKLPAEELTKLLNAQKSLNKTDCFVMLLDWAKFDPTSRQADLVKLLNMLDHPTNSIVNS